MQIENVSLSKQNNLRRRRRRRSRYKENISEIGFIFFLLF